MAYDNDDSKVNTSHEAGKRSSFVTVGEEYLSGLVTDKQDFLGYNMSQLLRLCNELPKLPAQ